MSYEYLPLLPETTRMRQTGDGDEDESTLRLEEEVRARLRREERNPSSPRTGLSIQVKHFYPEMSILQKWSSETIQKSEFLHVVPDGSIGLQYFLLEAALFFVFVPSRLTKSPKEENCTPNSGTSSHLTTFAFSQF